MNLFRVKRRVEFADTDMAGIVHFSAFFVYMEQAEHELLRSLGLSVVAHDTGDIRIRRTLDDTTYYSGITASGKIEQSAPDAFRVAAAGRVDPRRRRALEPACTRPRRQPPCTGTLASAHRAGGRRGPRCATIRPSVWPS